MRAVIHRNYADGVVLSAEWNEACSLTLEPEDARSSPLTLDQEGIATFNEVREGQDTLWVAKGAAVEELHLLRSPRSSVSYRVTLGPGASALVPVSTGGVELRDIEGRACLRAEAAFVLSSTGERKAARFDVTNTRLTVAWSTEGLEFPVLVDPLWTGTGTMTIARTDAAAAPLPDGRVLVAGGTNANSGSILTSYEIFDPASGTWTAAAAGKAMTTARRSFALSALTNGHLLATGGESGSVGAPVPESSAETYDPTAESWTATSGPLSQTRYGHTSTVLGDGRVLVVGGGPIDGSGNPSPVTELYSPSARTFSAGGALVTGRHHHAAARLADGRVLVAGGKSNATTLTTLAEIYDPVSNTWSALSDPISTGRQGASLVLLADGRALLHGGADGRSTALVSAELFDPSGAGGGTWSAAGTMNGGHVGHVSALLRNGKVVVAGGAPVLSGSPSSAVEVYDPGTNGWSLSAALTAGRDRAVGSLLPSGHLLIGGGRTGASSYTNTTEVYDPTSLSWTASGALSAAREYPAVAALPDGRVMYAGGYNGNGAGAYVASIDLYDAATGTASAVATLVSARQYATATVLHSGQVLIAGGANGSGVLQSAELFDPATLSVTPAGAMQRRRSRHTATLLENGSVLLVGGWDGSVTHADAEIYDPGTNTWTLIADPLSGGRYTHASVLLRNGKVLVFGGSDASSKFISSSELYDPATQTFSNGPAMQHTAGRQLPATVLLPNGKVLAAGGYDGALVASAEVYDPVSNTWSFTAGALAAGRTGASGILLPDGRVLVAGGAVGGGNGATTGEIYDPQRNLFISGGTTSARYRTNLALLPNGNVLFGGGASDSLKSSLSATEVFDPGYQTLASMAPVPTIASSYTRGGTFTITGSKLRGVSEASGGNGPLATASDRPLLRFTRLDNSDQRFVPIDEASATSLSFRVPSDFFTGHAVVSVIAHGVPSGNVATLIPAPSSGGTATHFEVTAFPDPVTAGSAGTVTVTALDDSGNVVTNYSGTVAVTSSDGNAVLPASSTLTNGTGSFSVTLRTAGEQSLTATDTVTSSITGTQSAITVQPATATSLAVSGFQDPVTAGSAGTLTVTALDAYGNVATTYSGTVVVTSPDGNAVLPASSTLTNGTGSFSVTLRTAGEQSLTATDSATSSITGTQSAITVQPAAATSLAGSGFPDPVTAGTAGTLTVTALDAYGNVATSYSGTVTITSSDGNAVLPASASLTNGTGSFSVTLRTAGEQSLTATDTVTSSITGTQSAITVQPAAATSLAVSGFPDPVTAGSAGTVTVSARDAYGNVATSYSGTVAITSSDGNAVLPGNSILTNGTGNFSVTLRTAGEQSLTATDTVTSSITGTQSAITVQPAAATSLAVSGFPDPVTAGTAGVLTVTALDAYGNVATSYSGTIAITSSDGNAVLPGNSTLTNGTGSFSVTLRTSGEQSLTATDTVTSSITGTQSAITVQPAAATSLAVSGFPDPVTAGSAGTLTVTALDAYGNVATSYSGTIAITSSDGNAVLPGNFTLTNGTGSFSVTLRTAGEQSLTATDTVTSSITGTQSAITVQPAAATSLAVSGFPDPVTAGSAGALTVTARDAYGNIVTNYSGTVAVTSSDGNAVLPASSTLTNGTGSFSVTLRTAGEQSLTATDTVTPSITGTQSAITVQPAAATSLTVSGFPDPVTAGTAGTVTVTALDASGNVATSYSGTVALTSSDGNAVLSPSATLTNGTGSFSVTLQTAGEQSLTATDTVTSSITGTQSAITVQPPAAATLSVSGFPDPVTAGSAATLTVTAFDVYGNVATSYSGLVALTSSDANAVLPASATLTNGTGSFNVTLRTAGEQSLTATDTVTSSITGTQSAITVQAAAATSLSVSGFGATARAGTSAALRVRALDGFGNVVPTFVGTATFTSTDPTAVLPQDLVFTLADGGDKVSSPATVTTTGTQTFTAAAQSLSGTHPPIQVTSANATTLVAEGFPTQVTAGQAHPLRVTARDPYGNVDVGYAGAISFSSTDTQAQLPQPVTLTGGVGEFPIMLRTAGGNHALTVTDGTLSGIQGGIEVLATSPSQLAVYGIPSPLTAGTLASVTVEARDAFGNTATSYVGTLQFTSTDSNADLPPPTVFGAADAGRRTFTDAVRFRTAGIHALVVSDGTLSGTQAQIDVTSDGPPVITREAALMAAVGTPYRYNAWGAVRATGALPLTYDRCGGPTDFRVEPATGVVSWTPSASGTVQVCVKALNPQGEDIYEFAVQVDNVASAHPVASFAANPASGKAPLDVTLDASGSTADPSALPLTFLWRMGDGSADRAGSPLATRYQKPGTYRTVLTAFDAYGRSSVAEELIRVQDAFGNVPPSARIIASATQGDGNLTVSFSCECEAGSAPIAGMLWQFGGDEESNEATPSYTFAPGRYWVKLRVVDAAGLPATDEVEIVVTQNGRVPPECRASVSPAAQTVPLAATWSASFAASAGARIVSQSWTFAPDDVVAEPTVSRTYTSPGYIAARLVVEDDAGLRCHDGSLLTAMAGELVPLRFVNRPNLVATCNVPFEYAPAIEGSGPVLWTLGQGPSSATVDAQSGLLAWTPTKADVGSTSFVLVASQTEELHRNEFDVTVECGRPLNLTVGCHSALGGTAGGSVLAWAMALWLCRSRHRKNRR